MPGLAVIVAVIDDSKVLLTKREDFEVWCLPGGGVEEGESLAEAGLREAKEETGLDVKLTRLVGVYSMLGGGRHDVHAVLYTAKPISGELKTQPGETIAVVYFPFEQIPQELYLVTRNASKMLFMLFVARLSNKNSKPTMQKDTHAKSCMQNEIVLGYPVNNFIFNVWQTAR